MQTPLVYYPEAGGAFGIAFIAGYAVGLIEDFGAIKAHWLHNPQFTEPDPEAASVYRRLFPVYCAFDTALDAPFAQLAATEVAS